MSNRLSNEITVICEQCSELDTTSTAMMVFNSGYVGTIMDDSNMLDDTLPKCSIYYYFSSTYEVCKRIQLAIALKIVDDMSVI